VFHYTVDGYHDDGPPALDQIVEACRLIEEGIQAGNKVLVFCPEGDDLVSHRSFSALCTSAHRIIFCKGKASEAAAPWQLPEGSTQDGKLGFMAYSWASKQGTVPPRSLSLRACLDALELGRDQGWLDADKFDGQNYCDLWRQYDLTWLVPGAIQVLGDPMSTIVDPDPATVKLLEAQNTDATDGQRPKDFASAFVADNVKLIVRLNKPSEPGLKKSYDPAVFRKHGIGCLDCSYEDINGGVPSKEIIKKVVTKCLETEVDTGESSVIAFHCKAGFGRSIAVAATWMAYKYDIAGDLALAWSRITRPGSITTPQQVSYLRAMTGRDSIDQDIAKAGSCCAIS
jgi:protein-tyrosine phosphatase